MGTYMQTVCVNVEIHNHDKLLQALLSTSVQKIQDLTIMLRLKCVYHLAKGITCSGSKYKLLSPKPSLNIFVCQALQ